MNYRLLPESHDIRNKFFDTFITPYAEFCDTHKEWISAMLEKHGMKFDEKFYSEMFMWDRITKNDRVISFADALRLLRDKPGEVLFLTEAPECHSYDGCKLSKESEFVATTPAKDLADCISYEWFTAYELYEQNCYLDNRILPDDLYIFDRSFTWCLVFTHETDESESAESRLCIYVDKNS